MEHTNLQEIEQKAWASVFQSGLIEIEIGLVLIVTFFLQIFSTTIDSLRFYFYLFYLIPVLFFLIANRYIVTPRMGIVNFGKERKQRNHRLIIIMTSSIIILLGLTMMGWIQLIPKAALFVGAIVFMIPASIAYFLDFNRMYIYAVLMALSFGVNEYRIAETGLIESGAVAWSITGIIMVAIGFYYLDNFIKKYPTPKGI